MLAQGTRLEWAWDAVSVCESAVTFRDIVTWYCEGQLQSVRDALQIVVVGEPELICILRGLLLRTCWWNSF